MGRTQQCPTQSEWGELLHGGIPERCALHLENCPNCQTAVEAFTRGDRTWFEIASGLREPSHPAPAALAIALERVHRGVARPPHAHVVRGGNNTVSEEDRIMTPRIHVERMPHRASVAVPGECATAYTLVKLVPAGLGGGRPLGLNLALALDVSGSMYEEDGTRQSRLQRVQGAALNAIQSLRPDDTLSVIAFAHGARMLLPPTPMAERGRVEDVLRHIDTFDVDPGGTAMDEGLALALSGVEQHCVAGRLSQVVMLTDGETSGEQRCRALARQAAERKIRLTLMGVGLDWKAALIKELAELGQGKWYYVDASEEGEAARVFDEEFGALAATAFLDVEMHLRPISDVEVKRVRQVVPEIREVALGAADGRNLLARLGTLQHDVATRYILDLRLPPRPDGKYAVASLELTYDAGTGRRESTGPVPLEMTYTAAGNGPGNAEVMRHIDDVQLKELNDELQIALERDDKGAAGQVAREIVRRSTILGPQAARKTQLAMKVLEELSTGVGVTRKTQLQLDDAARTAELPFQP